jgi:acetolactate synthase-1/2/3 large subunit
VAGAYLDSAAVVFVSGQAKSSELSTMDMKPGVRQIGTFELPIKEIISPIVKDAILFHEGEDIVDLTQRLIQIANSGRPGPVYLEFPLDLQSQHYKKKKHIGTDLESDTPSVSDLNIGKESKVKLEELISDLKFAARPIIFAGHGIRASNSVNLFAQLVNLLSIPVITTQLAKDLIPYTHPFQKLILKESNRRSRAQS